MLIKSRVSKRQLDINAVHKTFSELTNVNKGLSFAGRPLQAYQWGHGKRRVLLWSQMHGNEPTATRALQKLMPRLSQQREWQEQLSLVIIPILNPDGAAVFSRYNAMGIDINRDARALCSPESQFLQQVVSDFKPHWAFNLHDQRSIYSVGKPAKPATISFLAPSLDGERSISSSRARAIRLIGALHREMEKTLPGHCGRYSDEFYPRAWGDALQARGIPTVLIESGAYYNDLERNKAQQFNENLIGKALEIIAGNTLNEHSQEDYFAIPENEKLMRDLLLRQVAISWQGKKFTADVSLMQQEIFENGKLHYQWVWDEVGDLSNYNGLQEEEGGAMEWRELPQTGCPVNGRYYKNDGKIEYIKGVTNLNSKF